MHSTSQLTYGKAQSRILSGIAILLMLFHHFFGYPEWLKDGITCTPVLSTSIMLNLVAFSKMCVAIYAFNTGYAMWANQDKYTYSKIPARIIKFLLQYWIICILFILYALIANDNLPTLSQFAYNLFGFKTSLNEFVSCGFAWYVYFYVAILAISPILLRLFQCSGFISNCIIAAILICCARGLFVILSNHIDSDTIILIARSMRLYLSSVLMGIIVCKFNIFQTIDNFIRPRNVFFYIGLILFVIFARGYLHTVSLSLNHDAVWVVILIYSILGILRNFSFSWIEKCLTLLGEYSMNMWFLHAIFFTGTLNILQKLLYLPQYSIFVFIWGIILTLPMSMICSYLQSKLLKLIWFN